MERLTDAITFCLAKDIMPLYTVEKEGFKKLFHTFDQQYELPEGTSIFRRLQFHNCMIPPTLAKLTEKYLCIPASSSPSERVFSTAGCVVSKNRNCLKPDMVNKLVFLVKIL